PVDLDELDVDSALLLLEHLRQEQPDVAAADDNQPPCLRLLVSEGGKRTFQVLGIGNEIDVVAGSHLVVAVRHDTPLATDNADHGDVQVRKQLCQLPQRPVDDRTFAAAAYTHQRDLAVRQRDRLESSGDVQPPVHRARHLDLR